VQIHGAPGFLLWLYHHQSAYRRCFTGVAGRWVSHVLIFGGSPGQLSETFHAVLRHVYETFVAGCLRNLARYREWFPVWADAIDGRVAQLPAHADAGQRIFGFLDGTVRRWVPSPVTFNSFSGCALRSNPWRNNADKHGTCAAQDGAAGCR
jgi:hypothetical protein